MHKHTPEEAERFARWRALRDVQARVVDHEKNGAQYASHPDHKAWTSDYYAALSIRESLPAGEYPKYLVWIEEGAARAAETSATLDRLMAAAEGLYQESIDAEFEQIAQAETEHRWAATYWSAITRTREISETFPGVREACAFLDQYAAATERPGNPGYMAHFTSPDTLTILTEVNELTWEVSHTYRIHPITN